MSSFLPNPKPGEVVNDCLYKIRPLLDIFNNKMTELYYPDKELCTGESMLL